MACNALQVYGGAISVIVGPYAWSFIGTGGQSEASCANTTCTNCSVRISGTSITKSRALSSTSGIFATILVLNRALNYRRFLPTMISDVVHRQLVRGFCKSDRRRVQHTARLTFAQHRCTVVAWLLSFSLTFGARIYLAHVLRKQEIQLFQDFRQFSSIAVFLAAQL